MKYSKSTTKWLDKIAKRNNTTREKVEEYIKSLSRTGEREARRLEREARAAEARRPEREARAAEAAEAAGAGAEGGAE